MYAFFFLFFSTRAETSLVFPLTEHQVVTLQPYPWGIQVKIQPHITSNIELSLTLFLYQSDQNHHNIWYHLTKATETTSEVHFLNQTDLISKKSPEDIQTDNTVRAWPLLQLSHWDIHTLLLCCEYFFMLSSPPDFY